MTTSVTNSMWWNLQKLEVIPHWRRPPDHIGTPVGLTGQFRVAQGALEVLKSGSPQFQVAQAALEVLKSASPQFQVAQVALEVLRSVAPLNIGWMKQPLDPVPPHTYVPHTFYTQQIFPPFPSNVPPPPLPPPHGHGHGHDKSVEHFYTGGWADSQQHFTDQVFFQGVITVPGIAWLAMPGGPAAQPPALRNDFFGGWVPPPAAGPTPPPIGTVPWSGFINANMGRMMVRRG